MSVLREILAWSEATPPHWIRDALRRIVTQRELRDSDLLDLVSLCKKAHGLAEGGPDPAALLQEHVRESEPTGVVSLCTLTHVSDVNALEPGQTISFAAQGLTVVYGDNGAGKSGYARILKRACRARGSGDPVLPNQLSDRPAGTPTAKLKVLVNGTESEHSWFDGTACSPVLSAVSVFDTAAAQVYVTDKTDVRFRPLGLDVLDRLATACGAVKERLSRELALLQEQTSAWPTLPTNTAAARFLPTITALTTREAVDRAALMTEQEAAELKRLEEVLATARAEDPEKRSKELLLRRTRVTQLVGELGLISSLLGVENVRDLVDARRAATETERRAQEFAGEFKADVSLPGFASASWRRLWESAGHYSTTIAYPAQQFPHVAEGAVCVLCQQELQGAAKQRLSSFAAFVLNQAQQEARAAAQGYAEKLARVEGLVPANVHREEATAYDPGLAGEIEAFLTAAQECRDKLLAGGGDCLAVTAPTSRLERAAQELEARATELQRAADPEARRAAEQRHAELMAKQTLSRIRGAIDAEITRLGRINAYAACGIPTLALSQCSALI